MADFMSRAANRTVVTIIEIGLEEVDSRSGLTDSQVAWWLADDNRLIPADDMAAEDPSWTCAICSEGLEAEGTSGWITQICNSAADEGQNASSTGAASEGGAGRLTGHTYHEACLRRWLLKKNSCPVCRRAPVVPEL